MGEKLTKNFNREEFECRCGCGLNIVDRDLVYALQALRDRIGKPIQVISGCRCPSHNRHEGGARYSRHLLGMAADIFVNGMTARELYDHANRIATFKCGGIGVSDEGNYIHVDVRPEVARWCYEDGKSVAWYEEAKDAAAS